MNLTSATVIRNTFINREGISTDYIGTYKIAFTGEDSFPEVNFVNMNNAKITKHVGDVDMQYTNDTLMSDKHKIFWYGNIGLYNLFFERFTQLLTALKKHPDAVVIINEAQMGGEKDWPYYKFFLRSLTDAGINYEIYQNKATIYANNFSIIDQFCVTPEIILELKEFYKKYITNKEIKPFRKIYLSRKHMHTRPYFWLKDGLSTRHDNRLWDHEKLEKFLSENGFEIIIPEEKFFNFQDQINFMYEVDVLVSLSSSGIANALFMQPNTSILEFTTTFPMANAEPFDYNEEKVVDGTEALHHLYHTLSYVNDNCYFSIPNKSRLSDDIIKTINNNIIMKKIVMGDKND